MTAVESGARGLTLRFDDRRDPLRLTWRWLRDHCPCPRCLHPETGQRQLDSFALPAEPMADEASLSADGLHLDLRWHGEDHASRYPVAMLATLPEAGAATAPDPAPELWDAAAFVDGPPSLSYAEAMAGDGGLRAWLETLARFGFALLEDTPPEARATREAAERIGYLRRTVFGDFWEFTADLARADTAYTTLAIGPHTDGTYSHDAPGLQVLHCLGFEGRGGESVLVDGFEAARRLREQDADAYALLTEIAVPGRYLEPGLHLVAERPVLRLGADGRLRQVSFNNHDRAPFHLPPAESDAFYRALGAFAALIGDPALQLRFRLTPGRLLIFDNWRVLHGRDAYEGSRRLCGCYLNHEDFESRLRVLRAAGGSG